MEKCPFSKTGKVCTCGHPDLCAKYHRLVYQEEIQSRLLLAKSSTDKERYEIATDLRPGLSNTLDETMQVLDKLSQFCNNMPLYKKFLRLLGLSVSY